MKRPENRRDHGSQDLHRKRTYREEEYYVENSRTGTSKRENNSDQHKRNSTDSDHPKKRKTEETEHLTRNNPTPKEKDGVGEPEANGSKEKDNKQRETENVHLSKEAMIKLSTTLTAILGNKYTVPTIAEVQQQPEPPVARHVNKTTNKSKNRRERKKKSRANHNQTQDTTICYKRSQNPDYCKFGGKCKFIHD